MPSSCAESYAGGPHRILLRHECQKVALLFDWFAIAINANVDRHSGTAQECQKVPFSATGTQDEWAAQIRTCDFHRMRVVVQADKIIRL